jgi:hypothetical protein
VISGLKLDYLIVCNRIDITSIRIDKLIFATTHLGEFVNFCRELTMNALSKMPVNASNALWFPNYQIPCQKYTGQFLKRAKRAHILTKLQGKHWRLTDLLPK